MQVARRLRERRVRPAAQDDALFFGGHGGDDGAGFFAERLPRHAGADCHHHVDHEISVAVDDGVGVDLQVRERPPFVEHAQTHLGIARDRARFARVRPSSR